MAGTYDLPYTGNQTEILLGKVSELEAAMPTKVSDLTNDAGFITAAALPTNTSDLTNDSGFITIASVPTKVSQLQNDSSFATTTQLGGETSRAQGVEGGLRTDVDAINGKIPSAASSSNKLVDTATMNSSIATATSTFRGTSASGLTQQQFLAWANGLTHDLNDYVFWNTTDSDGNVVYKRYKWDGTQWLFEYDVNNSSFTAAQWAAINSAITSALVEKLTALPTNADLQTALNAKYVKPNTGIPATDLEGNIPKSKLDSGVQQSLGKADTALQEHQDISMKADKDTDATPGNVAKFDASGNPVDGGVALENIAQKDGSYEQMSVGTAKNLEGRTLVEDAFFERPTGGESAEVANGAAQMLGVKGRSVKYNQITAKPSENKTTYGGATSMSEDNGVLTLSPDSGSTLSKYWLNQGIDNRVIVGHKYLYVFDILTNETSLRYQKINVTSSTWSLAGMSDIALSYTPGVWSHFAIFLSPYVSGNYTFFAGLGVYKGNCDGNQVKIKNIQTFDLTATFGSDAEIASALGITTVQITTSAGVAAFESWLAANWGTMPYYPYSEGAVVNNNMTGVESVGFNLLDPATGKARIIGAYSETYGNYYGITGTHGTLTMDYDYGTSETVTPDADGKFELTKPGTLTVADAGSDCAVFFWWDGTQTEYEDYESNVAKLDVTHIYGKKNGTGDLVRVWPTGMPGLGTLQDSLGIENGEVVARRVMGEVDLGTLTDWDYRGDNIFRTEQITDYKYGPSISSNPKAVCGKYEHSVASDNTQGFSSLPDKSFRFYSSSASTLYRYLYVKDTAYTDATTFKTGVTGQKLYFELATPEVYTDLVYQGSSLFADGTPVTLPVNIKVNNWGMESVLPKNTNAVVTAPAAPVMKYGIDAVEQIDTIKTELETTVIHLSDLKANLAALASYLCTNYPTVFTPAFTVDDTPQGDTKVFGYHEVTEPEPEQNNE